ncbi:hypothetical protein [Thermomonospora cellulosilytica]|uniref:Putative membrane protein YdjX (TVP38/TMEM64 family) n=1 Tax=Thermomonospora cellulosilytica TaxID=1411118 RepID=A0A7W3MU13_9ACTN|nr:hypothetical protein [Thermomonospora cellulosilytica]MBA9001848.1 putative membrane protein YdjX (TVP38/TMEM64 family) [Thermomonospora cellulosilytica]
MGYDFGNLLFLAAVCLIVGLVWGAFIAFLLYKTTRKARRRHLKMSRSTAAQRGTLRFRGRR